MPGDYTHGLPSKRSTIPLDFVDNGPVNRSEPTAERLLHARLVVCDMAKSANDARVLLEALGLLEPRQQPATPPADLSVQPSDPSPEGS